jgi:hypothetical protein
MNLRSSGHIDPRRELVLEARLEIAVTLLEPVGEDVGHGDELGRAVLAEQGVLGGAGAAAAAADQRDLDGVLFTGMDVRHSQARQGRRHGELAGRLHRFAARHAGFGGIGHVGSPPVSGGYAMSEGLSFQFL